MFDDFNVKSILREYSVTFKHYETALKETLRLGDVAIVDSNVYKLYPEISTILSKNKVFVIEANENAKTYQEIGKLITQIIEYGFSKTDRIVAIGGGVVQDISAFSSSILFRGVEWVFFPTNLLTQCDSCIGSKTSINCGEYKNQLGGFYPPSQIYIDFSFWQTISDKEKSSGLGEMLHYFMVEGDDDLKRLESEICAAYDDNKTMLTLVNRSLSIKREMIEIDEFDKGPRNVFNYGHSFGHALESVTQYEIPHGIAVAYGMDLANIISARKGLISIETRNEIRKVLRHVWKYTPLPPVEVSPYFDALSKDKKNVGNQMKVILTKGLGKMFKTTLERSDKIEKLVNDFFELKLYEVDL